MVWRDSNGFILCQCHFDAAIALFSYAKLKKAANAAFHETKYHTA
jgi:hypothetical protein